MSLLKSYSEGKLTTLNTLKYGEVSETDGPLVQKTIPTTVGGSTPKTNELSARTDDLKRITKFLASGKGLKFLANQSALSALQTSAPTTGGTAAGNLLRRAATGVISGASIVGSTLAQIPVNGTGTHLVKGFFKPGEYQSVLEGSETISVLSNKAPRKLADNFPKKSSKTIDTPYNEGFELEEEQNLVNKNPPATGEGFGSEQKDYIPLRFTIVSSDGQPANNIHLQFSAYLDSFTDNFSSNWNSFNYVGRGEQFHTYSSFSRGISFSFKIAAQTRWEMRPLYQKIILLASSTAPTYSGEGFLRGTIIKVTIGDYIYELPGFLESVNYGWETNYPWEIVNDSRNKDYDQQKLPMLLNCSVNFKPIHTFTPQTGYYKYITGGQFASQAFIQEATDTDPGKPLTSPPTNRPVPISVPVNGPVTFPMSPPVVGQLPTRQASFTPADIQNASANVLQQGGFLAQTGPSLGDLGAGF
jgi:hypothetical protein